MISIKNYFQHTAQSVKKIGLAMRVLVGSITGSSFIQGNVKLAFYCLVAGGILDFILQCLPPGEPDATAAAADPSGAPGNNGSAAALITAVVLMLFISSCTVVKPLVNTVKTDTTYTTYKAVDYQVKGASVFKKLNMDSLVKAALIARDIHQEDSASMARYKVDSASAVKAHKAIPVAPVLIKQAAPVIQYVTDPQTKAQLSYWITQAGQIELGCQSKDQTIQTMQATINTLKSQTTTKTVVVYKPPMWSTVLMWVEGVLLGICLLILFIKSII